MAKEEVKEQRRDTVQQEILARIILVFSSVIKFCRKISSCFMQLMYTQSIEHKNI